MPRLVALLAVVLVAAAPLTGSADLTFTLASGDLQQEVQIGPEAESEAHLAFRRAPDGTAEVRVSVRAHAEADGVRYAATAEASARTPGGELVEGEWIGVVPGSGASLQTSAPIVQTARRVRPTEVLVRIDRVTDTEVHGAFVLIADREDEARVSVRFVAPRPADV